MPVAVATRREDRMGLFDKPNPLDEMEKQLLNLTRRDWLKLHVIAKRLAEQGVKSPLTKKDVTKTDVGRDFIDTGIQGYEAAHGDITDEMLSPLLKKGATPPETAPEPSKKKPAKKGGK